jgi:bifunctional non-homologous end joining protein LigD
VSALERLTDAQRDLLRPGKQPASVEPMKAKLTDDRFSDPDWIFETKLDGVRCLAFRKGERVTLRSRTDRVLNRGYPEIVEALESQACDDFVIDGEIVAFKNGITSFSKLQGRMGIEDSEAARATGIAVFLYAFDVIHLMGHDATRLPVRARKSLLRDALDFGGALRFVTHRNRDGEGLYEKACARGLEGLIAKRADSTYSKGGRSADWLKFKCSFEQELVIGGFTAPKGSRTDFGALLVGYHENGELRYAGKVGTGFGQELLTSLGRRMRGMERDDSPFGHVKPIPPGTRWIEPELVGQFGFSEWTRDGRLRHPRFLGLRDDKPAKDVVRERPS